jgi:hypothetical protein
MHLVDLADESLTIAVNTFAVDLKAFSKPKQWHETHIKNVSHHRMQHDRLSRYRAGCFSATEAIVVTATDDHSAVR